MRRIVIPIILTAHALCVLLYTHFCTDQDDQMWGIIYYLSDPLFFGLFAFLFKAVYVGDFLSNSFISIWGFMNIGRFIAYLGNYLGIFHRTANLEILLLSVGLGTLFIIISGIRHGIFKN